VHLSRSSRRLAWATLLVALVALPPRGLAQARGEADDEQERKFVEVLRREDPAEAERWIQLRDVRLRAVSELREAETQYNAAGSALRTLALPRLTQARRRYAEASLAVLDFLDTRDRHTLASYEEAVTRLKGVLNERQQTRAELEKLRQGR
jgi:hypothetical protein